MVRDTISCIDEKRIDTLKDVTAGYAAEAVPKKGSNCRERIGDKTVSNGQVERQVEAAAGSDLGDEGGISTTKLRTGARLSSFGAFLRALFNVNIDFYPRLGTIKIESISSEAIIAEMIEAMRPWKAISPSDPNLDKAIELARASLNEAKQQTEYQDQKATRLLTVTTFLTALAGAFFATFSGDYPLRTLGSVSGTPFYLLLATYLAFAMFVVSALAGGLVTFHGTRTRFKYPPEATVQRQVGPTRSFLFFREIIGVSPTGWANSFVNVGNLKDQQDVALRADLRAQYLQNYVSEAYLVAAKTADKLRYLQPAQNLLAWSLRFLLCYVALLIAVSASIEPTRPANERYLIEIAPSMAPPGQRLT